MTAGAWAAAYQSSTGHYDEVVDGTGSVRPHWRAFGDLVATATSLPLLLDEPQWREIHSGVIQRAALLDAVLADVYGTQALFSSRVLPASVVTQSAEFLRPLVGVTPAGGHHLIVYATDLGRDADGVWRVLHDRTQAPSGFGRVMGVRADVLRANGRQFTDLRVSGCEPFFVCLDAILRRDGPSDVCLWTPGPFNENHDEHRMLARQLNMRLVEGGDLIVQDAKLYVRTIAGLEPIHAVLRRLDGDFTDPLTLNPKSRLGVAGLVQVLRAGHVVMANSIGAGLAESSALAPHWAALARHLRGENLILKGREGDVALSTLPVFEDGRWRPRQFSLRVFAVQGNDGWQVMPGGLCQFIGAAGGGRAGIADVWVTRPTAPRHEMAISGSRARRSEPLMSRTADHLFWFGRYVERAAAVARALHALETRLATQVLQPGWSETIDLAQLIAAWGAAPYTAPWNAAQIAASNHDHGGSLPWLIQAASSNAERAAGALPTNISDCLGRLRLAFGAERLDQFVALQVRLDGGMGHDQSAAFVAIGRYVERAITGCRLAARYGVGPAADIDGAFALALELRGTAIAADTAPRASLFDALVSNAGSLISVAHDIALITNALLVLPPPAVEIAEAAAANRGDQQMTGLNLRCAAMAQGITGVAEASSGLPVLERLLIRLGDLVATGYLMRRDPIVAVSKGMAP